MYIRDRAAPGRGRSLGRVGGDAGKRAGTKGGASDGRAMGLEIGEQGRSKSGLSVFIAEQRLGLERRQLPDPHPMKAIEEAAKWEGQLRLLCGQSSPPKGRTEFWDPVCLCLCMHCASACGS